MKPMKYNIAGMRFGILSVGHHTKVGSIIKWECRCDCGNTIFVTSSSLRRGHTASCGCARSTAAGRLKLSVVRTKHGHARVKTVEYIAWASMLTRVTNPNNHGFRNYGGRGITVCARWLNSFENFLADMGSRPPSTSLERKNNEGNYEPGNCKWATREEQNSNKRSTILLEYLGKTQTATTWARELGIRKETLLARIRAGWSTEEAFTAPVSYSTRRAA